MRISGIDGATQFELPSIRFFRFLSHIEILMVPGKVWQLSHLHALFLYLFTRNEVFVACSDHFAEEPSILYFLGVLCRKKSEMLAFCFTSGN